MSKTILGNHFFSVALLVVLMGSFLIIPSCGGGGGGGGGGGDGGVVGGTSTAEGVWLGIYTEENAGIQFQSTALISSNGRVGIDLGNGVVFDGTATTSNGNVTIVGHESIVPSILVTFEGNVTAQALNATVTHGGYAIQPGDSVNYSYNSIYARSSSLDKIAATWSCGPNVFSSNSTSWTITIASNGSFTGSSGNFALSGTFSLIDTNKNEYQVNMTISDPSMNYIMNGNYSGIATVLDTNAPDDTLLIFEEGDQANTVIGMLKLLRN